MAVPPRRRARKGAMFARSPANRGAKACDSHKAFPSAGVDDFGTLATEVGACSRAGSTEGG